MNLKLCGKCAALMQDAYEVHEVSRGVCEKVVCANCGKRRYGGTYEVQPKKRTERSGEA